MLTPKQFAALKIAVTAATESQAVTGCPRELTIAQWALESGWGAHVPDGSNNPFGIKARPGDPFVAAATSEWSNALNRFVIGPANFIRFTTLQDAFNWHGALLVKGKPYRDAFLHYLIDGDLNDLITQVASRYATDPHYAVKIRSIIGRKEVQGALKT